MCLSVLPCHFLREVCVIKSPALSASLLMAIFKCYEPGLSECVHECVHFLWFTCRRVSPKIGTQKLVVMKDAEDFSVYHPQLTLKWNYEMNSFSEFIEVRLVWILLTREKKSCTGLCKNTLRFGTSPDRHNYKIITFILRKIPLQNLILHFTGPFQ